MKSYDDWKRDCERENEFEDDLVQGIKLIGLVVLLPLWLPVLIVGRLYRKFKNS
jgi:hypothetical protein